MRLTIILGIALFLMSSAYAQEQQDLYLVTLDFKDGKAKVVRKELTTGYAPLSGEAEYEIKGVTPTKGRYALPEAWIFEEFHEDGSIEATIMPIEGEYTIILPAVEGGEEIILKDNEGVELVSTKVPTSSLVSEGGSDFKYRYEWVFLLLKWIVIIIVLIIALRFGWKKIRKKK